MVPVPDLCMVIRMFVISQNSPSCTILFWGLLNDVVSSAAKAWEMFAAIQVCLDVETAFIAAVSVARRVHRDLGPKPMITSSFTPHITHINPHSALSP